MAKQWSKRRWLEYSRDIMRTFLWVLVGIDQLFLLLVGGVRLKRFELSEFAFREQLNHHSGEAAKVRRQLHRLLPEVKVLQKVELTIGAIASVTLLTHLNRPIIGALYASAAFAVISFLTQFSLVQQLAERLFEVSLGLILKITTSLHMVWVFLGIPKATGSAQPSSLAEFTDQLRRLPSTVLSPIQRQRLEGLLNAEDKTAGQIMTPKKRVVTVEPSATLGPIVLSDLQKTGHGYFPVTTKKGEPEGVLALSDVTDIASAKQRSVVRELMSAHIAWVYESASLYELAETFLSEKQYILFVRNAENELSGIVTIADLMKHLVGIVKE